MDWTEINCDSCRERFMCDRVKYDCPRSYPPFKKDSDELTVDELKMWTEMCNRPRFI